MTASREFLLAGVMLTFAAALAHGQTLGPDAGDRDKICIHGYSRSVRPPERITDEIKRRKAIEQSVSESCCELDHIYPICIGGATDDTENMQLQPWGEAKEKDEVEARTCREWCDGEIELPEALARFKRTHP